MTRRTFLAAASAIASLGIGGPAAAQDRGTARVTLDVEGMHCGRCARRIEDVVGDLRGVVSADVDFDQTRASVVYQPNHVTVAQIIRAIEDAGFQARVHRS